MPEKKDRPNNFQIAYAAKKGKFDPKQLRGAAKCLYNTMTEEELAGYARKPSPAVAPVKGQPVRKMRARSS